MPVQLEGATVHQLQALMHRGEVTSAELVQAYLARIDAIDRHGPRLRSIIEVNPDAAEHASNLDEERAALGPRGPLHGIPILIKDNIDTFDRMATTAGSLALVGARPKQDAYVVERLRKAGAVLLGKTNLSEWANFRSSQSSSGWSARGGQCLNPFALDRSPCGSSSGSAVAVAAALAPGALGTETDGSILCPGAGCGIVGLKPTVGLTSRAGVIPISHSQDTVGPMTISVADAAAILSAIAGPDARDPASAEAPEGIDYTLELNPDGLRGARIGVLRHTYTGGNSKSDVVFEEAVHTVRELGAVIVDPANIPTSEAMRTSPSEFEVLLYEFKANINAYLQGLGGEPQVRSLRELIEFNERHAAEEMPYFGQERFIAAEAKGSLDDESYLEALATSRRLSRQEGIDRVMGEFQLDALIAPTNGPMWKIDLINGDSSNGRSCSQPAAMAGYPAITVPTGYVAGLPVGLTFMGRAFSEPALIRLAYAFEQATKVYRMPSFVPFT